MFKLYNRSYKIPNEKENSIIFPVIPLNIFQTWHSIDLPVKMRENMENLKQKNPEFTYHLYDDQMCRDFIKEHFSEEIAWAFDKLNPGAYKADLWRYCILYIKGGIYLDIKFKCVDNFKLIELTDQEYWVRDIKDHVVKSIYQALMITFPKNEILWKGIQSILHACKTNEYSFNSLAVSGPSLLGGFFNEIDFKQFPLYNTGNTIMKQNRTILQHYDEYRKEQLNGQQNKHYDILWNNLDIYNYPVLKPENKINISNKYQYSVNKKQITYLSSVPIIIENNNLLHVYLEYNDDFFSPEGYKSFSNVDGKSIFSISKYDFDFNIKRKEYFFNFSEKSSHNLTIGLFDNDIYYKCNHFNDKLNQYCFSSNKLDINNNIAQVNIINENSYKTNNSTNNPSAMYCLKGKKHFIYNWFPLLIGYIDYNTNKIKIDKINYEVPEFFKHVTNASTGINHNNEVWFILNIKQSHLFNGLHIYHNKHFFAVFDEDMKFKRYSELFSFTESKNDFCRSFIFKDDNIIIGYGMSNIECYIAKYNFKNLCKTLRWFT